MSRNCFVPSCKEGHPSTKKKNKLQKKKNATLFRVPKDKKVLDKWIKSIPQTARAIRPGIDCVCEKHFSDDNLVKYFEHLMPDGSIARIERDVIKLKEGAIPTIFQNLPSSLPKLKKNKIKEVNCLKLEKNSKISSHGSNAVSNEPSTSIMIENLEKHLQHLTFPNDHWFISNSKYLIIFGCWDINFDKVQKKIVISKCDSKFQVFLNEKLIDFKDNNIVKVINCFDDIKQILEVVDSLPICDETDINERNSKNELDCKELKLKNNMKHALQIPNENKTITLHCNVRKTMRTYTRLRNDTDISVLD